MNDAYGTVVVAGADNHHKFSCVTFRDADGRIVRRERLELPDREALRQRLAQWPKGMIVVMEASFGWAWISDLMREVGLRPQLSNCRKVEQMRKARGLPKTNKLDADLVSSLPFETSTWWRVWMAPASVRDRREWMRHRADLVCLQTQTKNRIHAVFHRHGIFHEFSDLFGAKGRQFLAGLCEDGQGRLSGGALEALRGEVRMLEHVRNELAGIARRLRKDLADTELTQHLKSIPGFGLILSHVLVAEIGRMDRFRSSKALASYCLLAPGAHDSGEEDPEREPKGRHLGKQGNRTLKWAFIEAAHGAVRSGGRWREMFDRYTAGGKKSCNRGYIKVGRELVKVVHAIWKSGRTYTPIPPPRPGSGASLVCSRSGTG